MMQVNEYTKAVKKARRIFIFVPLTCIKSGTIRLSKAAAIKMVEKLHLEDEIDAEVIDGFLFIRAYSGD
jgi:hypothetical protein